MERIIANVKIVRRRGEWIVRAYDLDGKRMPEADYYTNDREDAEETSLAMTLRCDIATELGLINTVREKGK